MAFSVDPEIGAAAAAMGVNLTAPQPTTVSDLKGLRESTDARLAGLRVVFPPADDVTILPYKIVLDDGATIEARWNTRTESGQGPGSAVVYAHGGGKISGSAFLYDGFVSALVSATGVPALSIDYRLAPEAQGERPARDVFAGLVWLREHATELGVETDRIALMGDSGGGGFAAGAAILARDNHIPLARQILIYPMLDDRNTVPDGNLVPFAAWPYDKNRIAWEALLGDDIGTDRVSPVAAPARLTDFTGLAPAFIDVGELDIFRDECLQYARHLGLAGVSTELHLRSGAPHGFDVLDVGDLSARSHADRHRIIKSL